MNFIKNHLNSGFFLATIPLGIAPATVYSIDKQKITGEDRSMINAWLSHNCGIEERRLIENRLKTMGPVVEVLLLEALEMGPNKELMDESDRAANRRFDRRRQILDQGLATGLSESDLAEATSVSQQEFIDRHRQDLVLRYKSQALMGLGIVGGAKGIEILQKMADEDSALQQVARKALKETND